MFPGVRSALLAALVLAGIGCSDAASDDECQRLVAHMVDLELKEANSPDALKQRDKIVEAVREEALKHCEKSLKGSQVRCALAAQSLEEARRCDLAATAEGS